MSGFMIICSRARSLTNFRGPLIAALLDTGHTVHAVCPLADREQPAIAKLNALGVDVHFVHMDRTGTRVIRDLWLWLELLALMLRVRPRHVLAYTVKPVVYGLTAATVAGVPARYSLITGLGHIFINQPVSFTSRLVRKLYSLAVRPSRRVFFQNPDDRDLFIQLGILSSSERAVVINGSGVDLDFYSMAPLPEGPPVFLFIGRLLKAKGVREFAEASISLRRRHPHVRCQIVGWFDDNPDSIEPALMDQWKKEGIEYLGQLEDVRPAIRNCTVFVLPSYREGTPRTVLEAMAVGRPIITTDAPGCRETVMEGVNGWLVEVGSAKSLLGAMEDAVKGAAALEEMAKQSRALASRKYDVRLVTASLLEGMGLREAG